MARKEQPIEVVDEQITSHFALTRKDGLWQGIQYNFVDGKYTEVARSPGDMKVMALGWIENRLIRQAEDM